MNEKHCSLPLHPYKDATEMAQALIGRHVSQAWLDGCRGAYHIFHMQALEYIEYEQPYWTIVAISPDESQGDKVLVSYHRRQYVCNGCGAITLEDYVITFPNWKWARCSWCSEACKNLIVARFLAEAAAFRAECDKQGGIVAVTIAWLQQAREARALGNDPRMPEELWRSLTDSEDLEVKRIWAQMLGRDGASTDDEKKQERKSNPLPQKTLEQVTQSTLFSEEVEESEQ